MKKAFIYCQNSVAGKLSFYLTTPENREYYLFTQNFNAIVYRVFQNGITLDQALDFSNSKRHLILQKTMEKLPSYIRFLEKEYNFVVLKQSMKKDRTKKTRYDDEIEAA